MPTLLTACASVLQRLRGRKQPKAGQDEGAAEEHQPDLKSIDQPAHHEQLDAQHPADEQESRAVSSQQPAQASFAFRSSAMDPWGVNQFLDGILGEGKWSLEQRTDRFFLTSERELTLVSTE
jgi:hypothetical protein